MSTIETVGGPAESGELGLILAHEHLRTVTETVREQFPHLYDAEAELRDAVDQVRKAMDHGVETMIDPACMDIGRDAGFAEKVVAETGIRLIMCTGIYGMHYTFLPTYFQTRGVDGMVAAFSHDINEGIQGTAVKAAFLKCAVDEPGITDDVASILEAIAKTSLETGRPIMAHSHPATRRGLEIIDFFAGQGINPETIVVAHTGDTDDLDYIEDLIDRGPYIGMDRYGLDISLPTAQRNATVIELCRRGYAERMMLSHDACAVFDWYPSELKAELAPDWHFGFIFESVLPTLREGGVSDEQIDTMLREVPVRWLTSAG